MDGALSKRNRIARREIDAVCHRAALHAFVWAQQAKPRKAAPPIPATIYDGANCPKRGVFPPGKRILFQFSDRRTIFYAGVVTAETERPGRPV